MNIVTVTDGNQFGKLMNYVHDRIIQLEDLRFDRNDGVLAMPLTVITDRVLNLRTFLFVSMWKNPIVKSELQIHHSSDYEINDQAGTGEAVINVIRIENGKIILDCSNSVKIRVSVSSLEIKLGTYIRV